MAWKNGLQIFHKAKLENIMRQVERWYDVDVVYERSVPDDLTFTGDGISRNVSLAELLRVFENSKVKFEIDSKKVSTCNFIAIYPVTGWWKERKPLDRWRENARYSLLISLETPEQDIDIYSPIFNLVSTPVTIPVNGAEE